MFLKLFFQLPDGNKLKDGKQNQESAKELGKQLRFYGICEQSTEYGKNTGGNDEKKNIFKINELVFKMQKDGDNCHWNKGQKIDALRGQLGLFKKNSEDGN